MLKSKNCQNWPAHPKTKCVAAFIGLFGATAALGSVSTSQSAVAATCTVTSAPTLHFDSQETPVTDVDATSTIQVRCTKATPYNIGLDAGTGSGAAVGYSLYRDSAYTTVWGNTIGTDTVAATSAGSPRNHVVYGRMSAQSTHAAGSYADTITVTVTY